MIDVLRTDCGLDERPNPGCRRPRQTAPSDLAADAAETLPSHSAWRSRKLIVY